MAVTYKLIKNYSPVMKKAAYKVVVVENQTTGLKRISRHIQQATSLTPADIIGTLTALKEEMAEELKMGNNVHLPGIGYFSLAIEGQLYEDPRSHHYRLRNAGVRRVKFRPDMEFLEALRDIEFENITYTHGTSSVPTTDDIDRAVEELSASHTVFTVADLRHRLHLSQSYAYRLVARLEQEGKLCNIGTRSRKLYAKSKD
jgi:predicted histone-like DNA-binding protein